MVEDKVDEAEWRKYLDVNECWHQMKNIMNSTECGRSTRRVVKCKLGYFVSRGKETDK